MIQHPHRNADDPMVCTPRYTQEQVDFARETTAALRPSAYRAELIGTGGNCTALQIQCSYAPGLVHALVVTDHAAPQAGDHLSIALALTAEQDDDLVLLDEQPMTPHQVATTTQRAIHRQINGDDPHL